VLELGLELCKEGIGRDNLRCHMLDGVLGLIDGSLQVLVVSGVHLERGWDHKKGLISDRYHGDHGKKGNIME